MLVIVCLSWKCSEVKGVSYGVFIMEVRERGMKGVSHGVFVHVPNVASKRLCWTSSLPSWLPGHLLPGSK